MQLLELPTVRASEREQNEILEGLRQPQKTLPSKYFYDELGSQLFDEICKLPEYYPTRTEQEIMTQYIDAMSRLIGPQALLIELGSGSSQKTRTLLAHLPDLVGYIPIDISAEHLMQSAADIKALFPHLNVFPISTDYEANFDLPQLNQQPLNSVVYYPGSTIGNFHPEEAAAFLRHMRAVCGQDCTFLIGVDLKKDHETLHLAYNDRAGVTADFNLNILTHLNHKFGAHFDRAQFKHEAFYNADAGRIEMHLVSLRQQQIQILGEEVDFEAGECIWTESSYKYTPAEFAAVAAEAGLQVKKLWTDENSLFSVQYLTPTQAS